jgi:hypothetical protein
MVEKHCESAGSVFENDEDDIQGTGNPAGHSAGIIVFLSFPCQSVLSIIKGLSRWCIASQGVLVPLSTASIRNPSGSRYPGLM